jgi:hypothetical protein
MATNRDIPDMDHGPDNRNPDTTSHPQEAEILGASNPPRSNKTVSPDEEPDNTQGFQHGSWDYTHEDYGEPKTGHLWGGRPESARDATGE